jgi:D-glycero-alpha-D-manno-heptose-7-phosphate kinase
MAGRIEVIAPVRVDLAGGWTDLSPYTFDHGGEVVNFTINRYICAVKESVD